MSAPPARVPHLLRSTPGTLPGYARRGNSTRGNTLWGLQGTQGTRAQRREGEGVGGGEELGNAPWAGPPFGAVGDFKQTEPPPAAEIPFSGLLSVANIPLCQ